MYKAFIFDIDGTILNTAPTILDCIEKAILLRGLKVDKKNITSSLIGPKIADIVDILGIACQKEDKMAVVKNFRELYDNAPEPKTKVYTEVVSLLDKVRKQSSHLFVATNKPIKPTKKLLQYFGLDFFDDIYTPDRYADKTISKIDMLQEIIANNQLNAENVIFIGDTEGDLLAAHNIGCKFAFASWGYAQDKDELKKQADIVLEDGYQDMLFCNSERL